MVKAVQGLALGAALLATLTANVANVSAQAATVSAKPAFTADANESQPGKAPETGRVP